MSLCSVQKCTLQTLTGTADMMQQIASDVNRMKRSLLIDSTYHDPVALNLVPGDRLQKEARTWVSPPDPSPNYNIAREIHQNGTATWFCEGSIFAEWSAKGSLLWIHGKRASLKLFLQQS